VSIYCINGFWPGTLSIASRPRGDDWLEEELRVWKKDGIGAILSLLTPPEERELGLTQEQLLAIQHGLRFFSLPIADMQVPVSRTDALKMLREIERLLESGEDVAIHCRQGIGRSSLIAASLLVMAGLNAKEAFTSVSEARGLRVPETAEQQKWVEELATEFTSSVI
jgi:protein-tyrosine phosphatase